jgi:hypothetical protein
MIYKGLLRCLYTWEILYVLRCPILSHAWYTVGSCSTSWDIRDLSYGGVPLSPWDYVICGVALSIGPESADPLSNPLWLPFCYHFPI